MEAGPITVHETGAQGPEDQRVLLLKGLYDSGPDHWQSLWERDQPSWQRVRQNDWTSPRGADWVAALQAVISASDTPVILVAHFLGCCLVAHWARPPRVSSKAPCSSRRRTSKLRHSRLT